MTQARSAVDELDLDAYVDLCNARGGIEGVAIRLCARRAVSTATLTRIVEQMRSRSRTGDLDGLRDLDAAFHEQLCVLSDSWWLTAAFAPIAGRMRQAPAAAYPDLAAVPDEHAQLIAAIETADEARAHAALLDHIGAAIGSLPLLAPVSRGGVVSTRAVRPAATPAGSDARSAVRP